MRDLVKEQIASPLAAKAVATVFPPCESRDTVSKLRKP